MDNAKKCNRQDVITMKNKLSHTTQIPKCMFTFLVMVFLAPLAVSVATPAHADGNQWEQANKKPDPRKPRPKPGPTGEGDGD